MPRGISLHLGLNRVDPDAYGGWDGALSGCINDARDMKAIADSFGYTSTLLTDAQATCSALAREIGRAAQQLSNGDIFLCTYSGHGGQMPDNNGDEPDGQDETWVLYDRQFIDDELGNLWAQFAAGVRIFVLSDSCHSGSVVKILMNQELAASKSLAPYYDRMRSQTTVFRIAPPEVLERNYAAHREFYETAQWTSGPERAAVNASVLLISGCQDNQLSADGTRNGLFTQTLLEVWNQGAFTGNYAQFHRAIASRMPSTQTPNLFRSGAADAAFDGQKPFTIGSSVTPAPSSRPTIAISSPVSNSAAPPRFTVNPGANRYYVVEVTTNPNYFNNAVYGSQRTASNFYGSWVTRPYSFSASYPASYDLPQTVWDQLRAGASRLYYRIWATSSSNSWVNAMASVSDAEAASAPGFDLVSETASSGAPSITAADSFPNGSTPPSFTVNPGPNRYYAVEVTTNPWYFDSNRYGAGRNEDNFYKQWAATPFGFSGSYPARFEMPRPAWDRLRRSAARLYYRMWATDSPNAWTNYAVTTTDANAVSAPSFAVARGEEGAAAPVETMELVQT